MTNELWSQRLNAAFMDETRPRSFVRLPGVESLKVSGDETLARVHLPASAVVKNMQSNAAAFESWCLALHRWCGVTVHLTWDIPEFGPEGSKSPPRHYQRFLYRVARFHSLFGTTWFSLDDPTDALGRALAVSPTQTLWLNVSGAKKKATPNKQAGARWTEDRWECHLAHPNVRHLDQEVGLGSKPIKHQQVPVGLFSESKPTEQSAIFPGAKSAIDIVAVDGHRLWVFELKKEGNVGFGALSELMFYTWVMRDAVRGVFDFATSNGKDSRVSLGREQLADTESIEAVLLAPKSHPLIDRVMLDLIEEAVAREWKSEGPAIAFHQHKFDPIAWKDGEVS